MIKKALSNFHKPSDYIPEFIIIGVGMLIWMVIEVLVNLIGNQSEKPILMWVIGFLFGISLIWIGIGFAKANKHTNIP